MTVQSILIFNVFSVYMMCCFA